MPIEIKKKADSTGNVRVAATEEKVTAGYIAFIYADRTLTGTNVENQLQSGIAIEPGLTILIWQKEDTSTLDSTDWEKSILNGITANKYVMKTFSNDKSTSYEDDADDASDTTSQGSLAAGLILPAWNALYLSKPALRDAENNQLKHPKAPTPLQNNNKSNCSDITKSIKNFSWKNILKQYLISTL